MLQMFINASIDAFPFPRDQILDNMPTYHQSSVSCLSISSGTSKFHEIQKECNPRRSLQS